jgi:hypothetical protein
MSGEETTAILGSGVRTTCWSCGHCWDGWRAENPEGMACLNCESGQTRHMTKSQAQGIVMERLGLYLDALDRYCLRALREAYRYAVGSTEYGSSTPEADHER